MKKIIIDPSKLRERFKQGVYSPLNHIFDFGTTVETLYTKENMVDHSFTEEMVSVVTDIVLNQENDEDDEVVKLDATEEEIIKAAKQANAYQFIKGFPDKFETIVGERGIKLSGGQRQRIAIARALLKNPSILILDEAASALDPESEAIFIKNLSRIAVGKTVIMISHRLSTLVNAHSILVMQQGKLVDSGTHKQLLEKSETYSHLWYQQTSHI